ncbi:AEC family transporter [Jeotgalibacillus haloalkalitolerans]|uniref:AEC family transporter n=1 Tax=Jeotgalibacillus haloalkalitolerans TaxID=3104292 RepID=A0ABU5KJG3_9BACL|nr:AEC family transporter [Jeotgalibacillus sp. HH7-29]MDZ5711397.1 AEC family transporter [Jeotgalibacillus sp. HH7-29]
MNVLSVIAPIFIIFAVGFFGQKHLQLNTKTASTLALYLMSPFLAFRTFYTQPIQEEFLYLCLYAAGLCFILIGSVYLYGRVRRLQQKEISALVLSSAFMNNGNYGTPVILFAFGSAGFDVAIMLMVIQQLLMSTVGIYTAARGSESGGSVKPALKAVVRMPIAYGAFAGLALQLSDVQLAIPLFNAIDLIADAAIPTIMLILGMQLASIPWKFSDPQNLSVALITRLVLSPIVALGLTLLLPVDELTAAIMIIMAATPAAANTTMFAIQYGAKPEFVSRVTLFSTVLSVVTVPIVLWLTT